jgi:Protein of unknown function (DUF3047)
VRALALASLVAAGPASAWDGWRLVGLPQQKLPMTSFTRIDGDLMRVDANASYGNLVNDAPGRGNTLVWRWRLDKPVDRADLRRKEGDDAALKVCAMFDLPLSALPFWERQKMRLARTLSGEDLPAATLCYIWDPALPSGTLLNNAYTPRLRWIVLRGSGEPLEAWREEKRDLAADFQRAFGDESPTLPPLKAIAVGADADNTGGQSQARLSRPVLQP